LSKILENSTANNHSFLQSSLKPLPKHTFLSRSESNYPLQLLFKKKLDSGFLFQSSKDEVEIFYVDADRFKNTVFVWTTGCKDKTGTEYIVVIFIGRAQAIINDNPCAILK
jgi:hypothetical protein